MGCGNCSSGGCGTGKVPAGCGSNGSCGTGNCGKLDVFDWLAGMELSGGQKPFDILEVRFKNTRKEYFRNTQNLDIHQGETIVVEAASGFDIGVVSLAGELVRFQLKNRNISADSRDIKNVLRKPSQEEIDVWQEARSLEHSTMLRTRLLVDELKLNMKVSDVEYQADKSKATFYYTADDRVDFRELIRLLAEQFKLRVEMRQIGARQEAGRLGGIGTCGRELCCSTWLTDFRSVSTSAARYQQLAINPLKLAGQCGKLKCCLNYELDAYVDSVKEFPETHIHLKTKRGNAIHQKSDIFKRLMWYTYSDDFSKFYCLELERVKEIIDMNRNGKYPEDLSDFVWEQEALVEKEPDIENVVGQDSLTRFDQPKRKKKKKKPRSQSGGENQQAPQGQNQRPNQGSPRNPNANNNVLSNDRSPKPTQSLKAQEGGAAGQNPRRKKRRNNNNNNPNNRPPNNKE